MEHCRKYEAKFIKQKGRILNTMKVAIGIPAFNEEKNISSLLAQICTQKTVEIERIIVVNDASIDKTDKLIEIAKEKHNNVNIFSVSHKKRTGKNKAINEIVQHANSKYLIIMDADITLPNDRFLSETISYVKSYNAKLATVRIEPIDNVNLLSKIVSFGQQIKNNHYQITSNESNIYTCVGRCIIMHQEYYKSIKLPLDLLADDAYMWLYAKEHNHRYKYITEQYINYKVPRTFRDFVSQNSRYKISIKQLEKLFPIVSIQEAYHVSKKDKIISVIYALKKNALYFIGYSVLLATASIHKTLKYQHHTARWSQVTSTK